MNDKNKKNDDKYIWQHGEAEVYDSIEDFERAEKERTKEAEHNLRKDIRKKYRKGGE